MDVLAEITLFSSDQLAQTLSDGELDPTLLEIIKTHSIAGRHVSRIKGNADYRKQLGLSFVDFLDLEEALEKGLYSTRGGQSGQAQTVHPSQEGGPSNEGGRAQTVDPSQGGGPSNEGGRAQTVDPSQEGGPSNEGGSPDNNDSSHSDDDSFAIISSPSKLESTVEKSLDISIGSSSSTEEILQQHLSKEQIDKMDTYHRFMGRQQIENFNHCTANNIPCKRPAFVFASSPSPTKRPRSGQANAGRSSTVRRGSSDQHPGRVPSTRLTRLQASSSSRTVIEVMSKEPDVPSLLQDQSMNTNRPRWKNINEFPSSKDRGESSSSNDKDQASTSKDIGESSRSKDTGESSQGPRKILTSKKTKDEIPKKDIMAEHQTFLLASNLDKSHKALIQNYLQSSINFTYSVHTILSKQEDLETEWNILQRDGVVFGKVLEKILRSLVDHLFKLVPNPNLVSPEMRESVAVCLVASFPKLALIAREGDMPWSWLYNRDSNTGKIANIFQSRQRVQKEKRPRGGGTERRKRTPKAEQVLETVLLNRIPDSVLSKDAKLLKLLADNDTNKRDIMAKLQSTFTERRNLIIGGQYTVSAILQVFHHLRAFKGEMVEQEFRAIHKGKENEFLINFPDIASKLVALAEKEPVKYSGCLSFNDCCLNAMLVLQKFLPKPSRCYQWENSMDPVAKVSDLIEVLPVGSNIQNSIETRRQLSKTPIQPYILAVGTNEKLETFIIVLGDSLYLMLPKNTQAIRALDMLFKIHFVLNVHYSLGWKNVFRFIAAHIFHLPPENKRLSVFTDKWLLLSHL